MCDFMVFTGSIIFGIFQIIFNEQYNEGTKGAHPRGEGCLFSVQGRKEEGGGQRERVEIPVSS